MHRKKLTAADTALIDAAKDVITRHYQENRHHIGAQLGGQNAGLQLGPALMAKTVAHAKGKFS